MNIQHAGSKVVLSAIKQSFPRQQAFLQRKSISPEYLAITIKPPLDASEEAPVAPYLPADSGGLSPS